MPAVALGIVTALTAEAATLAHGAHVHVSGPGAERAERGAQALVDGGCAALVSWGVAAGLRDTLPTGAVVVAGSVLDSGAGAPSPPDERWAGELLRCCAERLDVRAGTVVSVGTILRTAADKARHAPHADVADLESAAVGAVATRHGLPWLCVRAVVDPSDFELPCAALRGMRPDGGASALGVLAGLARRPVEIGAVLSLGRRFSSALAALRAVARTGGPRLRFPGAIDSPGQR